MRYLIGGVLLCAAAEYAWQCIAWLSHGDLHCAAQCAWWGRGERGMSSIIGVSMPRVYLGVCLMAQALCAYLMAIASLVTVLTDGGGYSWVAVGVVAALAGRFCYRHALRLLDNE